MNLSTQHFKPRIILLFIFCFAFSTAVVNSQETTPKLMPIPHPKLDHLEKEIFDQLSQGRQTMEKHIANPELDGVNRALAYGKLGHLYHTYDFDDAAEACYYNAALLHPTVYRWNYCMGYILEDKGDMQSALVYYKRARSIQVTSDLVYLVNIRIGDCYKALNQLDNAGYAYELAEEILPEGASILARLGELAFARKEYEKAVGYLTLALEKAPGANKLHYPLAMSYRRLGKMDLAKDHLARRGKVGVQPPDPLLDKIAGLKRGFRVYILQGKKAFSAKRYEEALEYFKRAVASNPEDPSGHVNLGTTYVFLKDYDSGRKSLEKALELDPDNLTAHYNMGEFCFYAEEFDKAVHHLGVFIKHTPDDAYAHLMIANAYRMNRQPDEARQHYKKAIELDVSLEHAWVNLSTLFLDYQAYHEAIQILEAGYEKLPHNVMIAHQLARYLAMVPEKKLRNGARAATILEKVIEKHPDYDVLKSMAIAKAEQGDCAQAVSWIEKAIQAARQDSLSEDVINSLNRNMAHFKTAKPCSLP